MEECKRCLLLQSSREDIFATVKEHIGKISEKDKAEESVYKKRLDICKTCDNLISGTCLKCGCYVELRAAFKKQKCPDVKNKRW
jgi:hypothetical protein